MKSLVTICTEVLMVTSNNTHPYPIPQRLTLDVDNWFDNCMVNYVTELSDQFSLSSSDLKIFNVGGCLLDVGIFLRN